MARIRSLHPGQTTDEDYVELSVFARVCTHHLWCETDDHGVFAWKPRTLKMRIFPADNVQMEEILAELETHRQIKAYDVDGKKYGVVRNFAKWQKPKKPTYSHKVTNEMLVYAGFKHPVATTAAPEVGNALSSTAPLSEIAYSITAALSEMHVAEERSCSELRVAEGGSSSELEGGSSEIAPQREEVKVEEKEEDKQTTRALRSRLSLDTQAAFCSPESTPSHNAEPPADIPLPVWTRDRLPPEALPDLDAEFDAWWEHVPTGRKIGRPHACSLYKKARKEGASVEDLLGGIIRDAAAWTKAGTTLQYIPHPATWLNQHRWEGDPPAQVDPNASYRDDPPHTTGVLLRLYQEHCPVAPGEHAAVEVLWPLVCRREISRIDVEKLVLPVMVTLHPEHLVGRMGHEHPALTNLALRGTTDSLLQRAAELLGRVECYLLGPEDPEPVPLTPEARAARHAKSQQLIQAFCTRVHHTG